MIPYFLSIPGNSASALKQRASFSKQEDSRSRQEASRSRQGASFSQQGSSRSRQATFLSKQGAFLYFPIILFFLSVLVFSGTEQAYGTTAGKPGGIPPSANQVKTSRTSNHSGLINSLRENPPADKPPGNQKAFFVKEDNLPGINTSPQMDPSGQKREGRKTGETGQVNTPGPKTPDSRMNEASQANETGREDKASKKNEPAQRNQNGYKNRTRQENSAIQGNKIRKKSLWGQRNLPKKENPGSRASETGKGTLYGQLTIPEKENSSEMEDPSGGSLSRQPVLITERYSGRQNDSGYKDEIRQENLNPAALAGDSAKEDPATKTRIYSDPVKMPLILSGSFAELRPNHFHSGIDIKTGGVTGVPVYSVAEGVLSRIVVSPTGFGRALYINHPNGTTTVYGHLNHFRDDIEQYVKDIQYKQQSFRVDLQVPEHLFSFGQDELIGYSGNSGSSGGPHLHFEIRDTQTEEPLNPLKYGFPVKDRTPPRIYSLMIVPLDSHSHVDNLPVKKVWPVERAGDNYHLRSNPVIPVYGQIGIAIRTNDYFDESLNRCGIYSLRLELDGELQYSFRMDRFSFAETRYINSHIDYEEYVTTKQRFHKTWVDPGNRLRIYDHLQNNGILKFTGRNIHDVSLELTDTHGNTSVLFFNIESRPRNVITAQKKYIRLMDYRKENLFRSGGIKIDFPGNSFYTDIPFTYKKLHGNKELLTPIHVIHRETVPLHASAQLALEMPEKPTFSPEKMILVKVDTLSGKYKYAGGICKNGWVRGNIREFGNYAIAVDSIPPEILPLSIQNHTTLTEKDRIRFRISDELSGIEKIEGRLDGKWALFEYDPKYRQITHYFDAERFELGKTHHLKLTVTDNTGNEATYEATFWR